MSKCLFKKKSANAIKIVTLVGRAHNEMCISVGGKQPFSDAYVVKGGSIRKNTTLERGG